MELRSLAPMWLRHRMMELRGRSIYSQYADAHQCIFIHIPKTAGTSVASTLFGLPSRHLSWSDYQSANPRKFDRYFKFAFVRNPWDRLVSAYFYLANGGMGLQDRAWMDRYLARFPTFESFVEGWLTPDAINEWIHFRPQHSFICDGSGKLRMDFVGKVENIEADFAFVAARLGCSRQLARLNAGRHGHYSGYYTAGTRARVAQVYERDIELFGYRFEQR